MTGPLDPYASHANYSLYIREVSSVSGWITDPLHPGLSAGLYSYTRFFTPPGVQICTLPITEWELNHSGACENWCTQLILVEVPLVFPAFAHHMHTFPCFAEHHYTDSEQMSILGNVLQAFTPGCNVGAMWVQCSGAFQYPHHSQESRVAVQEEVTQCHPQWLRDRHQISPNFTLGAWVMVPSQSRVPAFLLTVTAGNFKNLNTSPALWPLLESSPHWRELSGME